MPIKKYKKVQAGPKSQLGGVKNGFFKLAYQVGIEEKVKREPIAPAVSQTKIEIISFRIFFITIDFNLKLFFFG